MPPSEVTVSVNASQERVFDILASFAWADGVSEVVQPEACSEAGSAFTTRTRGLGATFEIVMLIESWNAPSTFTVSSLGGSRIGFRGRYSVIETDGSTGVEMSVEVQLRGMLRPLAGLAQRAAMYRLRVGSYRLKQLAEGPPSLVGASTLRAHAPSHSPA
jgi:hypothetical protein